MFYASRAAPCKYQKEVRRQTPSPWLSLFLITDQFGAERAQSHKKTRGEATSNALARDI